MWNSWVDKASEVAKRAQEAAAQLEGQLNESVGTNKEGNNHTSTINTTTTNTNTNTTISDDFFEDDDDGFYDDDEEDMIVTTKPNNKKEESTIIQDGWKEEDDIDIEVEDIDVKDETKESTKNHDEKISTEIHPKVDLVENEVLQKEEEEEIVVPSVETLNTMEVEKTTTTTTTTVNETTNDDEPIQEVQQEVIPTKQVQPIINEPKQEQEDPSKELQEISLHEEVVGTTMEIQSQQVTSIPKIESPVDDNIGKSYEAIESLSNTTTTTNHNHNDDVVKQTNNANEQVEACVEANGKDDPMNIIIANETQLDNDHHLNNNECNDIQQEVIPQNENHEIVPTSTKNDDTNGQYEEKMLQMKESHEVEITQLKSRMLELQNQLIHRENQITSHVEQMGIIHQTNEAEKDELRSKIRETKEEAKRRIGKAKERVMEMEAKLKDTTIGIEHEQSIVTALRSEGEVLAKKQSEMEQKVRESNHTINELNESLENEQLAKETAQAKIVELEESLEKTQAELKTAKQGEVRAGKLDGELLNFREQIAKKDASILNLESRLKEYQEENDKLFQAVDAAEKNAVDEIQKEGNLLRQEKDKLLSDLELKLQTSENEAHEREESLRREISELRKRWQDAIRRADALNIDLQQSTAPLLRQLESVERQNRVKAATWAEVETKLRSDLEEYVVQHEKSTKERNELLASNTRLERTLKEKEDDLNLSEKKIEERIFEIDALDTQNKQLEDEKKQLQRQLQKMHEKVKEVDSKVRAEMMRTVRESEDFYQKEIESLKVELHSEREKASALHDRVNELMLDSSSNTNKFPMSLQSDRTQQRLLSSENQVDILQNTLKGMDDDDDDDFAEMDDQIDDIVDTKMGGSYVHMEQLSQKLTHSKIEAEALRKRLRDMETTRDNLEKELSQHRKSTEQLPELQSQIETLQKELHEKNMDLQSMTEDMEEVRRMYRRQLDDLLEEKAMITPVKTRPPPKEEPSYDQIPEVIDGSGSVSL